MIFTAAVDGSILNDARQLAAALAFSTADLDTFVEGWQDANATPFFVASFDASPAWLAGAQAALSRPLWDAQSKINMAGADRAQQTLVVWAPDMTTAMPKAIVGSLTVIGGVKPLDAVAGMGLVKTPIKAV